MLLIVRYIIHRRQHSEEEDEDLAASIERLKKELQQSADTIIKRLGSHVTKLEGLLSEADDRRVRLETRVADAQRLEWALRQRIEELERHLRDLGHASPPSAPPAVNAPQQPPPVQAVAAAYAEQTGRMDGDEFAAVLHASILREQTRSSVHGRMPQTVSPQTQTAAAQPNLSAASVSRRDAEPVLRQEAPAPISVQTTASPPVVEDAEPPAREDESIIKARALLRAGRTIEQVARETGVEMGALRLMKQMTQRD